MKNLPLSSLKPIAALTACFVVFVVFALQVTAEDASAIHGKSEIARAQVQSVSASPAIAAEGHWQCFGRLSNSDEMLVGIRLSAGAAELYTGQYLLVGFGIDPAAGWVEIASGTLNGLADSVSFAPSDFAFTSGGAEVRDYIIQVQAANGTTYITLDCDVLPSSHDWQCSVSTSSLPGFAEIQLDVEPGVIEDLYNGAWALFDAQKSEILSGFGHSPFTMLPQDAADISVVRVQGFDLKWYSFPCSNEYIAPATCLFQFRPCWNGGAVALDPSELVLSR